MEIAPGKHKLRKINPPRVPMHPIFDVDMNMNLFTTYRDLKLRWKKATGRSRKAMHIVRKWRGMPNWNPKPRPTCSFVLHKRMPHTAPQPEFPPPGRLDTSEAFCVFKSGEKAQHKVTIGDVVQAEKLHRRQAGDKITFGTVLLVGTRDWTLIGKPTVPYAKVKATVEQQTLTRDMITFRHRPNKKHSKFLRVRHWVTMLRIDEIVVDPAMEPDGPPPKPLRILDVWANRWLTDREKAGAKTEEDGVTPVVARLHDGSEDRPGMYHRKGMLDTYRWIPDPQAQQPPGR